MLIYQRLADERLVLNFVNESVKGLIAKSPTPCKSVARPQIMVSLFAAFDDFESCRFYHAADISESLLLNDISEIFSGNESILF